MRIYSCEYNMRTLNENIEHRKIISNNINKTWKSQIHVVGGVEKYTISQHTLTLKLIFIKINDINLY